MPETSFTEVEEKPGDLTPEPVVFPLHGDFTLKLADP